MKNLQIINSETLKRITSKRSGETKFFEHTNYLSNLVCLIRVSVEVYHKSGFDNVLSYP